MRGLPQVAEYEVSIRRVAGLDDLLIRCETVDAATFEETARSVVDAFRGRFNIRVSTEQAPAMSLPRYELKARRFKRV
jgi:phenylacetate-coenzyme A ligase PaaK-like adenylate-forming protein